MQRMINGLKNMLFGEKKDTFPEERKDPFLDGIEEMEDDAPELDVKDIDIDVAREAEKIRLAKEAKELSEKNERMAEEERKAQEEDDKVRKEIEKELKALELQLQNEAKEKERKAQEEQTKFSKEIEKELKAIELHEQYKDEFDIEEPTESAHQLSDEELEQQLKQLEHEEKILKEQEEILRKAKEESRNAEEVTRKLDEELRKIEEETRQVEEEVRKVGEEIREIEAEEARLERKAKAKAKVDAKFELPDDVVITPVEQPVKNQKKTDPAKTSQTGQSESVKKTEEPDDLKDLATELGVTPDQSSKKTRDISEMKTSKIRTFDDLTDFMGELVDYTNTMPSKEQILVEQKSDEQKLVDLQLSEQRLAETLENLDKSIPAAPSTSTEQQQTIEKEPEVAKQQSPSAESKDLEDFNRILGELTETFPDDDPNNTYPKSAEEINNAMEQVMVNSPHSRASEVEQEDAVAKLSNGKTAQGKTLILTDFDETITPFHFHNVLFDICKGLKIEDPKTVDGDEAWNYIKEIWQAMGEKGSITRDPSTKEAIKNLIAQGHSIGIVTYNQFPKLMELYLRDEQFGLGLTEEELKQVHVSYKEWSLGSTKDDLLQNSLDYFTNPDHKAIEGVAEVTFGQPREFLAPSNAIYIDDRIQTTRNDLTLHNGDSIGLENIPAGFNQVEDKKPHSFRTTRNLDDESILDVTVIVKRVNNQSAEQGYVNVAKTYNTIAKEQLAHDRKLASDASLVETTNGSPATTSSEKTVEEEVKKVTPKKSSLKTSGEARAKKHVSIDEEKNTLHTFSTDGSNAVKDAENKKEIEPEIDQIPEEENDIELAEIAPKTKPTPNVVETASSASTSQATLSVEEACTNLENYFKAPAKSTESLLLLVKSFDAAITTPEGVEKLQSDEALRERVRKVNAGIVDVYAQTLISIINSEFSKIDVNELDLKKKPFDILFKNVMSYLNSLTGYIQDTICSEPDVTKRNLLIERFLQLSKELVERGDFCSADTIFGALQSQAIVELVNKKTDFVGLGVSNWVGLSEPSRYIEKYLSSLFNAGQVAKAALKESEVAFKGPKIPKIALISMTYDNMDGGVSTEEMKIFKYQELAEILTEIENLYATGNVQITTRKEAPSKDFPEGRIIKSGTSEGMRVLELQTAFLRKLDQEFSYNIHKDNEANARKGLAELEAKAKLGELDKQDQSGMQNFLTVIHTFEECNGYESDLNAYIADPTQTERLKGLISRIKTKQETAEKDKDDLEKSIPQFVKDEMEKTYVSYEGTINHDMIAPDFATAVSDPRHGRYSLLSVLALRIDTQTQQKYAKMLDKAVKETDPLAQKKLLLAALNFVSEKWGPISELFAKYPEPYSAEEQTKIFDYKQKITESIEGTDRIKGLLESVQTSESPTKEDMEKAEILSKDLIDIAENIKARKKELDAVPYSQTRAIIDTYNRHFRHSVLERIHQHLDKDFQKFEAQLAKITGEAEDDKQNKLLLKALNSFIQKWSPISELFDNYPNSKINPYTEDEQAKIFTPRLTLANKIKEIQERVKKREDGSYSGRTKVKDDVATFATLLSDLPNLRAATKARADELAKELALQQATQLGNNQYRKENPIQNSDLIPRSPLAQEVPLLTISHSIEAMTENLREVYAAISQLQEVLTDNMNSLKKLVDQLKDTDNPLSEEEQKDIKDQIAELVKISKKDEARLNALEEIVFKAMHTRNPILVANYIKKQIAENSALSEHHEKSGVNKVKLLKTTKLIRILKKARRGILKTSLLAKTDGRLREYSKDLAKPKRQDDKSQQRKQKIDRVLEFMADADVSIVDKAACLDQFIEQEKKPGGVFSEHGRNLFGWIKTQTKKDTKGLELLQAYSDALLDIAAETEEPIRPIVEGKNPLLANGPKEFKKRIEAIKEEVVEAEQQTSPAEEVATSPDLIEAKEKAIPLFMEVFNHALQNDEALCKAIVARVGFLKNGEHVTVLTPDQLPGIFADMDQNGAASDYSFNEPGRWVQELVDVGFPQTTIDKMTLSEITRYSAAVHEATGEAYITHLGVAYMPLLENQRTNSEALEDQRRFNGELAKLARIPIEEDFSRRSADRNSEEINQAKASGISLAQTLAKICEKQIADEEANGKNKLVATKLNAVLAMMIEQKKENDIAGLCQLIEIALVNIALDKTEHSFSHPLRQLKYWLDPKNDMPNVDATDEVMQHIIQQFRDTLVQHHDVVAEISVDASLSNLTLEEKKKLENVPSKDLMAYLELVDGILDRTTSSSKELQDPQKVNNYYQIALQAQIAFANDPEKSKKINDTLGIIKARVDEIAKDDSFTRKRKVNVFRVSDLVKLVKRKLGFVTINRTNTSDPTNLNSPAQLTMTRPTGQTGDMSPQGRAFNAKLAVEDLRAIHLKKEEERRQDAELKGVTYQSIPFSVSIKPGADPKIAKPIALYCASIGVQCDYKILVRGKDATPKQLRKMVEKLEDRIADIEKKLAKPNAKIYKSAPTPENPNAVQVVRNNATGRSRSRIILGGTLGLFSNFKDKLQRLRRKPVNPFGDIELQEIKHKDPSNDPSISKEQSASNDAGPKSNTPKR